MYADPLLKAYQNRAKLTPPNDLYLEPDAFLSQDIDGLDFYYDYSVPRLPQFDLFYIYLFYKNGQFHYLWRISKQPWVAAYVPDYPEGAFSYIIPEEDFLAVALKVKEVIDKIEDPRMGMSSD